jgi:hypothetical protein
VRERVKEKEKGRERVRKRERERRMYNIFKRNDGCLGTF